VFLNYLWPEAMRDYLARTYRHLICDNDEDTRAGMTSSGMAGGFQSALLITMRRGNRFLGADPKPAGLPRIV
jgi:hypothetical protein